MKTILFALVVVGLTGCNKLVEVETPVTFQNAEKVFENDGTANAVVNSIYTRMSGQRMIDGNSLNTFLTLYSGLSSDEYVCYGGATPECLAFYRNLLLKTTNPNIWGTCYPTIFQVNGAIEGVAASRSISQPVAKKITGEALFLRALNYFYLVQLYGKVPIILGTDYRANALASRVSIDSVNKQIITDLLAAIPLLTEKYISNDGRSTNDERTIPIRWAAKALLAREYLYTEDYANAEAAATDVINQTSLYNLTSLDSAFLKNSREAIWQLQPVNVGWNTEDARTLIVPSTGLSQDNPVYLSSFLLDAFETGDQRRTHWVNSRTVAGVTYNYPYKYKSATRNASVTEYENVFRLAEQYLIRAEARVNLGKLSDAENDLMAIRHRAGLGSVADNSHDGLLKAILHERQVELFSEWGHRWLDLKRTKKVDEVMGVVTPLKGGSWSSDWQLYPLYSNELTYGVNLTQNPGY